MTFKNRLLSLAIRFAKYVTVNASSFIIDISIVWILVSQFHIHYVFAVFIGLLVATAINYTFGRKWVFKGTTRELKRGYLIALLVSLFLLILIPLIVWVLVEFFGINYLLARILTSLVSGTTAYILDSIFTYNMPVIPNPAD